MGLFSALTKTSWERTRRKAEKAAAAGDPAAAYQLYGEALEASPNDEREALAEARARAASELHAAHVSAAADLVAVRQLDAAAERYRLALRFAGDDAERQAAESALRNLASRTLDREEAEAEELAEPLDSDEAVDPAAVFAMLISDLDEDIADGYEALGETFRDAYLAAQSGRPAEAVEIYVALLAQHPESAILHYERGNALVAQGNHEAALEPLQRADSLAPQWIDVKLTLAELAWKLERWPLAEEILQRTVDVVQDDPRVYAAIGRTALYTKSPEYGLEATEAGLELDPGHRDLILVRAQLLELAERDREALVLYEQQVERHWRYDPETDRLVFDRDAGLLAARLYYRRGERLERADELMRAVLHVTPPRGRWQFEVLLAEILIARELTEEGQALAQEASFSIPEDEPLWRLRALDLAGDAEAVGRLLGELDDDQRAAWDARQSEREPA